MTTTTTTTTTKTLRALVYARQSHGEKKSIRDQTIEITDDLDDLAAESGAELAIVGTFKDETSASRYAKKQRNDHPKVLAAIAAGEVDMIGLWATSRSSREMPGWTAFLDLCRVHGVLIRDVGEQETYDMDKSRDRKHLWSEGIENAEFSEKGRTNTLRGVRSAAQDGLPNGPVPYGYLRDHEERWVPDPDRPGEEIKKRFPVQTADPETAPIVEEVFRRVAAGEPIKPLAEELNKRAVPTAGRWRRKGNHAWTPHGIRAMVKNVTYIGKRRHKATASGEVKVYDSTWWPAIVDEALFWAANRVLDERSRRHQRVARAEHVLSGIPRCDDCGDDKGVFSGTVNTRYGKRYGCRVCGASVSDGTVFEDRVIAYVLGRLAKPDVRSSLRVVGEDADTEAAAAEAEVAKLERRLNEWRDEQAEAVINGTAPSQETMARIEAKMTAKITAARKRVEQVGVPPQVRRLIEADDVYAEWDTMVLSAKRDVIADLVEVRVAAAHKRRLPLDERVTITWKAS
jgi:DNA invertase Pin-like site-specific DNA recombinase